MEMRGSAPAYRGPVLHFDALLPAGLELELILSHMAQGPVLRGEVGARTLRLWSVSREGAWRARVCRALGWVGVGVRPTVHDASGAYLICGGLLASHSTPMHDPGQNQEFQRPVWVCVCKGAARWT